MILLVALLAGLIAGLILALLQQHTWNLPPLRLAWLAVVAFLPQIFVFYLPATRRSFSDAVVAGSLIGSQAVLLSFCWFNRRLAGIWLLALGLALNLAVIVANGGFMPISPQTASRLASPAVVASLQLGERFGYGKDVLLLPERTNLVWLSDRFLPPSWSAYQVAFSAGDILIAGGAFWLMLTEGKPLKLAKKIKDTE